MFGFDSLCSFFFFLFFLFFSFFFSLFRSALLCSTLLYSYLLENQDGSGSLHGPCVMRSAVQRSAVQSPVVFPLDVSDPDTREHVDVINR